MKINDKVKTSRNLGFGDISIPKGAEGVIVKIFEGGEAFDVLFVELKVTKTVFTDFVEPFNLTK